MEKHCAFYCCGPTVYGPAHIGNFRTFVMQDVFRRVLELGGVPTTHIRNLTDVDDKTIRDSQKAGVSLAEFTAGWTALFHRTAPHLIACHPMRNPPPWAIFPNRYGWSKHWWKRPCLCLGRRFRVFQNFLLPGIRKAFPPGRRNWLGKTANTRPTQTNMKRLRGRLRAVEEPQAGRRKQLLALSLGRRTPRMASGMLRHDP